MGDTEAIITDVAVIGGGPAGLMAAGTAASRGVGVVLIEKNTRPGRKLLITGKGRCNITNADTTARTFLEAFGKKGRWFNSAFHAFGVEAILSFFESRGVQLKTERGGRVFPESDRAADVLGALTAYCREQGVTMLTGTAVTRLAADGNRITHIETTGPAIAARSVILCTGGLSYPATGSTGDGFRFARDRGHAVVPPRPALVPVLCAEPWIAELEGLSLRNVAVSLWHGGKKAEGRFGEALFTARGMSGPVILDLSRRIGELLPNELTLSVDLKPALEHPALDERIRRDFADAPNRLFRNGIDRLLPASLVPVMVRLAGVDPEKKLNAVTREERRRLLNLMKDLRMTVTGMEDYSSAIITAGGVDLSEIELRTMRSRLVSNLFFAGEIMDIDGPTGGYNLQICWTTGHCAGWHAAGE